MPCAPQEKGTNKIAVEHSRGGKSIFQRCVDGTAATNRSFHRMVSGPQGAGQRSVAAYRLVMPSIHEQVNRK